MSKCTSSYTIMDYTDGITLLTKISSNLPQIMAYDPSTGVCTPDWATTNLQLTPSVVKAGTTMELTLSNTAWYYRMTGTTTWSAISGLTGATVTGNVLKVATVPFTSAAPNIEFKFSFTYHDSTLNLDFTSEATITFTRVSNGTSVVIARAWAVDGDIFKNNSTPSSLQLKAELVRGVTSDATNLTYTWKQYVSGSWTTITTTSGKFTVSGATLTVYPGGVDSYSQFRCEIYDSDSASDTYQQTFTSNALVVTDISDPYSCVIESSAGQFFKNSTGSTTLKCRVFQNGTEVDAAGTGLTYTWSATNEDGDSVYQDTNGDPDPSLTSGTAWSATGKSITVTHDMISVKGTFFCEVS